MAKPVPVLKSNANINRVRQETDRYIVVGNQKVDKEAINRAKAKGYTDDEINAIISGSNIKAMEKDNLLDHSVKAKESQAYASANKQAYMKKYDLTSDEFDKAYNNYVTSGRRKADAIDHFIYNEGNDYRNNGKKDKYKQEVMDKYDFTEDDFNQAYEQHLGVLREQKQRDAEKKAKEDEEWAKANPKLAFVKSVLDNVILRPAEGVAYSIASSMRDDLDPTDRLIANQSDAYRQGALSNIDNGYIRKGLEIAGSGVDMLGQLGVAALTGGGSEVIGGLQAASTLGDVVAQSQEQGNSQAEAITKGLLSSALTFGLSKYGADELFKMNPKTVIGSMGKGVLTEGLEEGAEYAADLAIDEGISALTGSQSGNDVLKKQLKAEHPDWTDEQINNAVIWTRVQEGAENAAAGGIMGGAFGGARAISPNSNAVYSDIMEGKRYDVSSPVVDTNIEADAKATAEQGKATKGAVDVLNPASINPKADVQTENTNIDAPSQNVETSTPKAEVNNQAEIDKLYNDFTIEEQGSGHNRSDKTSDIFKTSNKPSDKGFKQNITEIINNSLTPEQKAETKGLRHEISMAINEYAENPTKANYDAMMEKIDQIRGYIPEYNENGSINSTIDGNEPMPMPEMTEDQILNETASGDNSDIDKIKYNNTNEFDFQLNNIVNHPDVAMHRDFNDAIDVIRDRNSTPEQKTKAWTDLYQKYETNQAFFDKYGDSLMKAYDFVGALNKATPTNTTTPISNTTQNDVPTVTQNLTTPDEQIGSGKGNTRGYVQSVDMPEDILQQINASYNTLTNAETNAKAQNILEESSSLMEAKAKFDEMVKRHEAASVPLGYNIAQQCIENGEHSTAVEIIDSIAKEMTKAGQFSQAAYITALRNNPLTALASIQKEIRNLNDYGQKRFGKKWTDFELTNEEIEAFNNAKQGDTEAIKQLTDMVYDRLAEDYPHKKWDQIYDYMRTNMLLNPRTHLRNVVANAVNVPIRSLSDRTKAITEAIYGMVNKDYERTSSFFGGTKEQKGIAREVYQDVVKPLLEGADNRWESTARNQVEKRSQMWKDNKLYGAALKKGTQAVVKGGAKAVGKTSSFFKSFDRITNGKIQGLGEFAEKLANVEQAGYDVAENKVTGSILENARRFDYWALGDLEDDPFVKTNFVNALANFMKAQGINNRADIPQEAITMAYDEALKATFKDDNQFTKMLSNLKKNSGKLGDIAMFFTKTPANLAMRGVDYSPVGIYNSVKHYLDAKAANNGKVTNHDISLLINDLSKNFTGTGLILVGYALRKNGLITGSFSDDEDEAAWQKMTGFKENAFHIGDNYYTYDWSQPATIPLLLGSAIFDGTEENDKETAGIIRTISSAWKGGKNALNAWIELSPLKNLQELLGGGEYGSKELPDRVISTVLNTTGSLVPGSAFLGATARGMDTVIRYSYDKGSAANTYFNQRAAQIPMLSKNLPASYDVLGREVKRTDGETDFFNQYVNPGSFGYENKEDRDVVDYIGNLYESTGDKSVFPSKAERDVTIGSGDNKEKKTLTNEEHSKYQKSLGRGITENVRAFTNVSEGLSEDEQIEALKLIYSGTKQKTENELFGKDYPSNMGKTEKEKLIEGPEAYVQYVKDKLMAKRYDLEYDKYTELMNKGGEKAVIEYAAKRSQAKDIKEEYGLNSFDASDIDDAKKAGKTPEEYAQDKVAVKNFNETYGTDINKGYYDGYKKKGANDKQIAFIAGMDKSLKGNATDYNKMLYIEGNVSDPVEKSAYAQLVLSNDTLTSGYMKRGVNTFSQVQIPQIYKAYKDADRNGGGVSSEEAKTYVDNTFQDAYERELWYYVLYGKEYSTYKPKKSKKK